MSFLTFAAGVLCLTFAGLLIVESIARKLPNVRERRRRERVAKLRAEAAGLDEQVAMTLYTWKNSSTGIPSSQVADLPRLRARAAEARAMANHYAENDAP